MARGNARMDIYHDDDDRERFLAVLDAVVDRYELDCGAYCLMPNHYHLLVRTTAPNLSRAIRQLNGVYAQWWNRRHERVGHVLQGRFKAQVVQERLYLLAVSRYVVLNPVRAHLVEQPEQWPWSSYRATVGIADAPRWLSPMLVLDEFGDSATAARAERFAAWVCGPDALPQLGASVRSDCRIIGDETYARWFADVAGAASPPVPSRDRLLARPALDRLFDERTTPSRLAMRVLQAKTTYGYSFRQIARHLQLHPDALRRRIRRASVTRALMSEGRL